MPTDATGIPDRHGSTDRREVQMGSTDRYGSTDRKRKEIVDATSIRIDLAPGANIRQYELIRELGRGGMGQIFLARDTKLGRKVALKFLVRRFYRTMDVLLDEARATARCSHPNIVVVYEVDAFKGLPYLALEYLQGKSLRAVMEQGPIPPGRAVELMVPVVRALATAHSSHIVHRDLKPENIFVTDDGLVKVLDFGLATLVSNPMAQRVPTKADLDAGTIRTQTVARDGMVVGTPLYMSPEQYGAAKVDDRTDIWAVGMMLFEMIAGRHPLDSFTPAMLLGMAATPDTPITSLSREVPSCPSRLAKLVDGCLVKKLDYRISTAGELLELLEPLLPGKSGRAPRVDDNPYPGLGTFTEDDTEHFHGRSRETRQCLVRLENRPIVGIVGPSGAGKSSLIQAGVIPRLRESGEPWRVIKLRPGKRPLAAMESALTPILESRTFRATADLLALENLEDKLTREPGFVGQVLREHCKLRDERILLFVDQFEELFTQCSSPEERTDFINCLLGSADDTTSPVRVLLSVRSDFVDRLTEFPEFVTELGHGLIFLGIPGRQALAEAITKPAESMGYRFESGALVERMLNELEFTSGSLPLLQFACRRLWETRNTNHKVITEDSYWAIGGIEGTLAAHADDVVESLPTSAQELVRDIMKRLVTAEGTRATIETSDLRGLGSDKAITTVLERLSAARLIVIQTGVGEGAAIELVHESLITAWPTLRRWLDEDRDNDAFLHRLRQASKQWLDGGRSAGFLWRGEGAEESKRFLARFRGYLSQNEQEFVDAVLALHTRSARRKRAVFSAVAVVLIMVAVASVLVALKLNQQKDVADAERDKATDAALVAKKAKEQAEKAKEQTQAAKEAQDQAVLDYLAAEAKRKDTDKRLRALLNSRDASAEEIAEEKRKLAAAEKRIAKAQRALQSEPQPGAAAPLAKAEKEIKALERKVRDLQSEDSAEKLTFYESQIREFGEKEAALTVELSAAKQEIKKLRRSGGGKSSDALERANATIAKLEEKLAKARKLNKELKGKIANELR
jgi:serine/threonine protein kinase